MMNDEDTEATYLIAHARKVFLLPMAMILCLMISSVAIGQPKEMVRITGGTYVPLYGNSDSNLVKVRDFYMDTHPVTHTEFIEFLYDHPKWRKSKVIALYADDNYLAQFETDLTLKKRENPNAPVTNVSWFAAKAYCASLGKRLPSVDEWEYAAMADDKIIDARKSESYNRRILSWYETPTTYRNAVGDGRGNYWGLHDMHGLVWEWTSDYNSVLISGESRGDVEGRTELFCGGAAVGATDLMNYAAFMRYAFRGSLKSNYTIRNLGFRCAVDADHVMTNTTP